MNLRASPENVRGSSQAWANWRRGLIFVLSVCLFADLSASAGTYYVSNLLDSGPGSLRQAILDCNVAGEGSILVTNLVGTIALSDELPAISANTWLEVRGSNQVSIDGRKQVRVLTINPRVQCTLKQWTIRGGSATNIGGGGILNFGNLTLIGCVIAENSAGENLCSGCNGAVANGGGIYSTGKLIIFSSCISNNAAKGRNTSFGGGPAYGGGFYATGETSISNSLLVANAADGGSVSVCCAVVDGGAGYGGAGYTTGFLRLYSSLVANNGASGGSGSNSRAPGLGGGLAVAAGAHSLLDSTFSDNHASVGGNLFFDRGTLSITGCTIVHGSATSGSGIGASITGVTLRNTIVAYNGPADDLSGPITSLGYNLFGAPYVSAVATDLVGFDPLWWFGELYAHQRRFFPFRLLSFV